MKTSAYNIEAIVDENDTVYILELGPRNGGSYIPQLIKYATGVDLVDYTIRAAMGEDCSSLKMVPTVGCWSNYMLLSTENGIFENIWFDKKFKEKNLLNVYCTSTPGDVVHAYQNTTHSLGTMIFKADTIEEMQEITNNIQNYYRVIVKK